MAPNFTLKVGLGGQIAGPAQRKRMHKQVFVCWLPFLSTVHHDWYIQEKMSKLIFSRAGSHQSSSMRFVQLFFVVVIFHSSFGSAAVGISNSINRVAPFGDFTQSRSAISGTTNHHGPLRLRGGTMSFLAAYMLLKIGGKEAPTKVIYGVPSDFWF